MVNRELTAQRRRHGPATTAAKRVAARAGGGAAPGSSVIQKSAAAADVGQVAVDDELILDRLFDGKSFDILDFEIH
jgi:hypothetical protein